VPHITILKKERKREGVFFAVSLFLQICDDDVSIFSSAVEDSSIQSEELITPDERTQL
jgi:hypothetical protein